MINARWFILLFATFTFAASTSFAHNGSVAIVHPVKGITIDGDLSDWPEGMTVHQATRAEYGEKPNGEEDLSCQFRVGYSEKERALFIAVEVADDSAVIDPKLGTVGEWNVQDGCEIYIDRIHLKDGTAVEQYSRYGDRFEAYGGDESNVELKVGKAAAGRIYEWRVLLGDAFSVGCSIGFDLSALDKDEDGSFTWMAWGSEIGKRFSPDKIGDLLLLSADEKVGRVAGAVRMDRETPEGKQMFPPLVIQSLSSPNMWTRVSCDASGCYATDLPDGSYTVSPVDTSELRVIESDHIHFQVHADRETDSGLLHVSKLERPDLIGAEGVLRTNPVDPKEVDRFVTAYMRYYQIPGVSLAIINDSKTSYHATYGVKNAVTKVLVNRDTAFEACSLTKPVFAFAVNRLVEKGVLDLNTPLHKYLPVVPGHEDVVDDDRYKRITAKHVLAHRTGLPNWRNGKLTMNFEPGTDFGYSGEGFEYLGAVVSGLTKKNLCEVVDDEVFKPLGIKNSYLVWGDALAERTAIGHVAGANPISKSKTNEPGMAYSLHSDAFNYAKLLTAILQRKGLSEATYAEMLKQQFEVTDPKDPGERPYGLGVVAQSTDLGMKYSHEGVNPGWRCKFVIYDELKMGFVVFTNNEQGLEFAGHLEQFLIVGRTRAENTN